MRFDLHVHSTASDGSLSAVELVGEADRLGLAAIAITDHDSVDALPEALQAAHGAHPLVIPGVELSAAHRGRDVHILGYFVDPADERLASRLVELREARRARAALMVDALREAGFEVDLDDVLLLAENGSVGRSHVARALVDRGHAESIGEAFDRFIGRGKPYYVAKPVTTPPAVVQVISQAGGLPVLAHPGVTGVDDLLPELRAAGLVGIEAFHAEHDQRQRARYSRYARRHGLLATGGSDFHGPFAPGADLGSVRMPDRVLRELLEAGGATFAR